VLASAIQALVVVATGRKQVVDNRVVDLPTLLLKEPARLLLVIKKKNVLLM
jgi:hypothetical protein